MPVLPIDVPDECRVCDRLCNKSTECNSNYCYSANIITFILFLPLFIILLIRFIQFQIARPRPFWTIKNILYLFGLFLCLTRLLRGLLVFFEYQTVTVGLFFDQILLWYGSSSLVAMFSLLIQFWAQLCRKSNVKMTLGLEGKGKNVFIIGNITVFGLSTVFAFIAIFVNDYFLAFGTFSAVTITITFILLFGTIVEGRKVSQLIKGFSESSDNRNEQLLKKTTRLVVTTSVTLFVCNLVLAIWAVILVTVTDNFSYCQSGFVWFKFVEVLCVSELAYALGSLPKSSESSDTEKKEKSNSRASASEEITKEHSSEVILQSDE